MKNLIIIVTVVVSVLLTSCSTPSTLEELRKDPVQKYTFQTSQNYQAVYRKLVVPARKCLYDVDSDLYHDIKEGHIYIKLAPNFFAWWVDIKAIDDSTTSVTVYEGFKPIKPIIGKALILSRKLYKAWTEGSTSCELKANDGDANETIINP